MPGTDREDVQLENIRGRPLKIQQHTAQHSPKIVDEAKREGESTESESITEAETETDVEAPKSLPNLQPNAETRSRSRSRIRSAARWATHPYIRASLPEIFVSLQLHIVDRSVGHIGRLRTVIEDRNESAWVSVLKRRETPRGRESKKWKRSLSPVFVCSLCAAWARLSSKMDVSSLQIRSFVPSASSTKRHPTARGESALDTRRIQNLTYHVPCFIPIATSSRGETRSWRVLRRIGWLPGITAADAAWTPCRWRQVSRTNGLSNVLSVKM